MAANGLARRITGAARARPARAAFAGVFSCALVCFLAVGAVLPVLPRYVTGPVGAGSVAVGVVIGAFAPSAVIGRPIGGRLADARGRRPVVAVGLGICAVAGALLFVPSGVGWLVLVRLVLGLGDGWVFTAGLAWAVDLAPAQRRGQAIGLFGLAVWCGLSIGSLVGEALFRAGSFEAVWAFATVAPLAGVLVARALPERRARPAATAGEAAAWLRLPRPALRPGCALALSQVGYATMAGFVVLHLAQRGVAGGALMFTVFAAAVVATRLLAGGLVDRVGPVRSAIGAAGAEAAGLALLAVATSLPAALAGALVTGAGFSLLFPALALLVVGRVDEVQRGVALGAFTAFFDIGVGLGAPLAGAVAALAGYPAAFWVAAGMAGAGALVGGGVRPALGPRREPDHDAGQRAVEVVPGRRELRGGVAPLSH